MKSNICPKCGNNGLEILQTNQYGCKRCRTLFVLSDITQEEMIEWFVD